MSDLKNPVFKEEDKLTLDKFLKRQEKITDKEENKFIEAGSMVENSADAAFRKLRKGEGK